MGLQEQESYDEMLDEDGKPYFEPLNWDILVKKYAGPEEAS